MLKGYENASRFTFYEVFPSYSFIYFAHGLIKYEYFLNIFLTHAWDYKGITIPGQSEPGSNGNEESLYTL